MHLNSNDIFSQIGLIVDNNETNSQRQTTRQFRYKAFLEIELSEGRHQILQIQNYDDPYKLALNFCKKHQLNDLATEVIERKIREAQLKEQQNISRQTTHKEHLKTSYTNYPTPKTPTTVVQSKLPINKQQKMNKIQHKPSKNKISLSPKKLSSKQKNKKAEKAIKIQKKQQKRNNDVVNELYGRGMIKMKMRQRECARAREQKQKEQINNLTFQPKINQVSVKIVQFRRENGPLKSDGQKQNKKQNMNMHKSINVGQQMQQCTFKPQINKVSEMIIQNRTNYKEQYDHFTALYHNLQYKPSKTDIQQQNKEKQLFHPKINPKNHLIVTQNFQQRLQKSLIRKKQIQQGKFQAEQEYTFQPKVGRAPKEHSNDFNGSRAWWDELYTHNIKKNQLPIPKFNEEKPHQTQSRVNPNSNVFYENLVEKRINQIFDILDGDQDGQISNNLISIQNLTKSQLIFLMPLFQQIDQLDAVLNFSQFRKALILLLQDSDLQSRGSFLSSKKKTIQQSTFQPLINQKSKAIVNSRINGVSIHEDLYDKGLRQLQKKQYKIQKCRAIQQQRQLQDCSFKPLINSSSKYYIQKVLGKKTTLNIKHNDQSIVN